MVLTRIELVAAALAVLTAGAVGPPPAHAKGAPGASAPPSGEVTLPLADYLALVDSAERADAARRAAEHQDPTVAEVVAQHAAIRVAPPAGGPAATNATGATAAAAVPAEPPALEARIDSRFEVLVQGRATAPVELPLAGVALAVDVQPAGAGASAGAGADGGGLALVAPGPGRYTVLAQSAERLEAGGGPLRFSLPRIVAPVAALDLDIPAGVVWECAGTVAVADRVQGDRRLLRLSAPRGAAPELVLRPAVAGDQAAELLVQDVVTTFLQLRPDGLRRHDVVLYEVARGALADLVVDLPPGLEVERAATDEGEVVPVVLGSRLVVHRRNLLRAGGYLVLSSRPPASEGLLPLPPVIPETPPRARYLATASALPASFAPRPAAAWVRVDLDDLPAALRGALAAQGTTAAWRLDTSGAGGAGPAVSSSMPASVSASAATAAAGAAAVEIAVAPRAPALETVVRRRLTTTLLTVDGTLLHRDTFQLAQAGQVLVLDLPAGAALWSAAIDGAPVRPLQRGASLEVPLGAGAHLVEVVEVLERAVPHGRERLGLELAQVHAPVVEHRWRLLLPASARYRFAGGSLAPAPARRPDASSPAVTWLDEAAMDPWASLQATGLPADRPNVGGSETGTASAPAALSGRIVDQHDVALPGVTVTLAPVAGASSQVQTSDLNGKFAFHGVQPGIYHLRAELQGFAAIEVRPFPLAAGAARRLQVVLDSPIEDVITVTSETPLLDERKVGNTTSIPLGSTGGGGTISSQPKNKSFGAVLSMDELSELRQGLVGGVRPLPVAVPEDGKALLLAGILPPARVTLDLEVKPGRRAKD